MRRAMLVVYGMIAALFLIAGAVNLFMIPHLSLAESVRITENNRASSPEGMPGFRTAMKGVCLSGGIRPEAFFQRDMDERTQAVIRIVYSAIAETPGGDLVDIGSGGTPSLMEVLREADLCGRRLWSSDPVLTKDAFRLRVCNKTCASASIPSIAVLRLGGEFFDDAATPLVLLYAKIQAGGYVVVDHYYSSAKIKSAVDAFRKAVGVLEPLNHVEEKDAGNSRSTTSMAWWQRSNARQTAFSYR